MKALLLNDPDVHTLHLQHETPSVTLTLPLSPSLPGQLEDPLRLKHLVREAEMRLLHTHQGWEVEEVLTHLESAAELLDRHPHARGLVFFVNRHVIRVQEVHLPVKASVVVSDHFMLRDVVHNRQDTLAYWVVLLTERTAQLLRGQHDHLQAVQDFGFPVSLGVDQGEGSGSETLLHQHEHLRRLYRTVDTALTLALQTADLPVVLLGVEQHLKGFREVAHTARLVVVTHAGNFEHLTPAELARLILPELQAKLTWLRHERVQEQLRWADEDHRILTDLQDIWQAALDGKGRLLVVVDDFQCPAVIGQNGRTLQPHQGSLQPAGFTPDVVDDLIQQVLHHGGEVAFLEAGVLPHSAGVLLVLRD